MCANVIRKNVKSLSDSEKQDFIKAIWALKNNGKYDLYVRWHALAMSRGAHRGSAFLPWHREYLHRFERDLQDEVLGIALPYWDWSEDGDSSDPSTSSFWNDDLMGGNGDTSDDNIVKTGPFGFDPNDIDNSWVIIDGSGRRVGGLQREFGAEISNLPTSNDVQRVLSEVPYDSSPWNTFSSPSFRNMLEGFLQLGSLQEPELHNKVHVWVGGSMMASTSPNDPVFFLNHCFVDKIWADWQKQHPSEDYVPDTGASQGHNLNDRMIPWHDGITPAIALDHQSLGYQYDTD